MLPPKSPMEHYQCTMVKFKQRRRCRLEERLHININGTVRVMRDNCNTETKYKLMTRATTCAQVKRHFEMRVVCIFAFTKKKSTIVRLNSRNSPSSMLVLHSLVYYYKPKHFSTALRILNANEPIATVKIYV